MGGGSTARRDFDHERATVRALIFQTSSLKISFHGELADLDARLFDLPLAIGRIIAIADLDARAA